MGTRNYLIDGVSASGKTTVCRELQRHIWHVDRVEALIADRRDPVTVFCGGSRNHASFVHLFDAVFVLEIDLETPSRRLDVRPADEWGSRPAERELVLRLHETRQDLPAGIPIDATVPLTQVVDEILRVAAVP